MLKSVEQVLHVKCGERYHATAGPGRSGGQDRGRRKVRKPPRPRCETGVHSLRRPRPAQRRPSSGAAETGGRNAVAAGANDTRGLIALAIAVLALSTGPMRERRRRRWLRIVSRGRDGAQGPISLCSFGLRRRRPSGRSWSGSPDCQRFSCRMTVRIRAPKSTGRWPRRLYVQKSRAAGRVHDHDLQEHVRRNGYVCAGGGFQERRGCDGDARGLATSRHHARDLLAIVQFVNRWHRCARAC